MFLLLKESKTHIKVMTFAEFPYELYPSIFNWFEYNSECNVKESLFHNLGHYMIDSDNKLMIKFEVKPAFDFTTV